jgi:hypothetical protein
MAGMRKRTMDELLDAFMDLGPAAAPQRVAEATRVAIRSARQRRARWPVRRLPAMNRFTVSLGIATGALVIVAISAIAFLVSGGNVGDPADSASPTPPSTTALSPCLQASSSPTASGSPEALTWSPDRASQDWPGALRTEPSGCAPVVVDAIVANTAPTRTLLFHDPQGDPSPTALAWVDLVDLEFRESGCYAAVCVFYELAAAPPPVPNPRDEWIAYGIVVDSTGDGRPDQKYGVDNALGGDELRIWRVDVATGRTTVPRCCQDQVMDVFFPGDQPSERAPAKGSFDVPWGTASPFRFYLWASVIRDGEIVSTDFAPDFGWLEWTEVD